jgi:zinc finger-containing ubiquitin peptidase 1
MMCSALLQVPALKKVLFGGLGHVPTVPCVQEFLEAAWSEGFDAEGAGQLGGSVFGTRKWIGTTECVTLLRSFKIRAEIVDFISAPATEGPKTTKKGKQQSITDFVTGASSYDSKKSTSDDTKKKYKPNKELFEWMVAHFEEQAQMNELTGAPILPVYLQHFGHSRTVVGFERTKGNQVNLLIFDPSIWGKNIPSDIASSKLQKIRRTAQSFTHKEYQVAFVQDSDSLLTDADRDRSKKMSALRRIISK